MASSLCQTCETALRQVEQHHSDQHFVGCIAVAQIKIEVDTVRKDNNNLRDYGAKLQGQIVELQKQLQE